jgi:hypothetical protein
MPNDRHARSRSCHDVSMPGIMLSMMSGMVKS